MVRGCVHCPQQALDARMMLIIIMIMLIMVKEMVVVMMMLMRVMLLMMTIQLTVRYFLYFFSRVNRQLFLMRGAAA